MIKTDGMIARHQDDRCKISIGPLASEKSSRQLFMNFFLNITPGQEVHDFAYGMKCPLWGWRHIFSSSTGLIWSKRRWTGADVGDQRSKTLSEIFWKTISEKIVWGFFAWNFLVDGLHIHAWGPLFFTHWDHIHHFVVQGRLHVGGNRHKCVSWKRSREIAKVLHKLWFCADTA